ncbi:YraN family protein [Candidatus Poriferisodalis sp.]|uniref:YraN family protein n=1 Tax=Candidatus Poriferisodalis sp. TaxID=3101277 RepID=UPI003AF8786D
MTARRQALGRYGEDLVERWYIERGYRVLDRNWRCPAGELDLVVTDGTQLVVCEVKTRSSDRFGTGFEAITARKQQQVRRLAAHYVRQRGGWKGPVRFDAAAVMGRNVEVLSGAF